MQRELTKKVRQLAYSIQKTLDEDNFILDYQPVMDLKNPDKPIFMLTCRMQTDSGQLLAYRSLRQLTAEVELDLQLDRYLALKGLNGIKKLRQSDPGSSIFIPVSVASFTSEEFPKWLARQLELHDFPGNGMIIACRLSALSRDIRAAHRCINELQQLNIRISIQRFSNNPLALKVLHLLQTEYIEIPPRLLQAETQVVRNILDACSKHNTSVVLCDIKAADKVNLDWSIGANMLMGSYIQPPKDNMKYHFPPTLT